MSSTQSDPQSSLRAHVLDLLRGRNAHLDFESALKDLQEADRGRKPAGSPHTIWQLVEHLRIAQLDILEFSRDARHLSPKWPEEYWPESEAPTNDAAWEGSLAEFRRDQRAFSDLIADQQNDLFALLPNAPGEQTLLREALLLADHNGYHLGQIVTTRKILEASDK
jgi:hypothetical protein